MLPKTHLWICNANIERKQKEMKKAALFLFGILMLSCAKESETTYSTNSGSEKAFLLITENTTESDLVKIAAEFKSERNITVDFSETEFYGNGKIENLKLQVDCNDGFKGNVNVAGEVLEIKNSGFVRDYSKKAERPFSIGAI